MNLIKELLLFLWNLFKLYIILTILLVVYYTLARYFDTDAFWSFINKYFFWIIFFGGIPLTIASIYLNDRDSGFDAEVCGERYEEQMVKKIRRIFKTKNILRHVLIPTPNGATTEADIIAITPRGLFCVECKYHSTNFAYNNCAITDQMWNFGCELVANPFLQNDYHIQNLERYLGDASIPIYNILISTADLMAVLDTDEQFHYTSRRNRYRCYFSCGAYFKVTKKTICRMPKMIKILPTVLTKEQVRSLTESLKSLCGDTEQRHEHALRMQQNQVMSLLPDLNVSLIWDQKLNCITSASKYTALQQIKVHNPLKNKKYVILYVEYLTEELEALYTIKAMIKKTENPKYAYSGSDIKAIGAHMKDVYVTGFDILSYKEMLKYPEFRQRRAIVGSTEHDIYTYFLCNISKVEKPPENYIAYLPRF